MEPQNFYLLDKLLNLFQLIVNAKDGERIAQDLQNDCALSLTTNSTCPDGFEWVKGYCAIHPGKLPEEINGGGNNYLIQLLRCANNLNDDFTLGCVDPSLDERRCHDISWNHGDIIIITSAVIVILCCLLAVYLNSPRNSNTSSSSCVKPTGFLSEMYKGGKKEGYEEILDVTNDSTAAGTVSIDNSNS